MLRLIAWLLVQMIGFAVVHAADVAPSEMYAQAVRVEREVEVLKQHLKAQGKVQVLSKAGDLRPRHIRAMTYVLLFKLGKLRRALGLTYIQPGESEPSLGRDSSLPWGTLQRVLTEIQVIKYYKGIPGASSAAVPVSGKTALDVYNKLHQISGDLDLLVGPVTPSEVYGEVKRLDADVDAVIRRLHQFEKASPPARRENLLPRDSLGATFDVLAEVQRIQRQYGMEVTDFKGFDMGDKSTSDDVFGMVEMTLAEWQRIKAQVGLMHLMTPAAGFEEGKKPSDVVQLLGYVAAKMRGVGSK